MNHHLIDELAVLVGRLAERGIQLVVGGGLGLWVLERTRDHQSELAGRATKDIDVLLPQKLLADAPALRIIRDQIADLGYTPVEKYLHFEKGSTRLGENVRIELLACWDKEIPDFARLKAYRFKNINVKELHGYHTPAGGGIDTGLIQVPLYPGDPERLHLRVSVPSLYNFLILKLHAASDRLDRSEDDLVAKHSLDILRIVSIMDRIDWDNAVEHYAAEYLEAYLSQACRARRRLFESLGSPGVQAIARTEQYRQLQGSLRPKVVRLIDDLESLFPF